MPLVCLHQLCNSLRGYAEIDAQTATAEAIDGAATSMAKSTQGRSNFPQGEADLIMNAND